MSRNLDQLASLNSVSTDNAPEEQKIHEDELQMFSNTTFFDYDMGRSTDIATTVDELLMQQEKQIQYPQKQQLLEETGPVAGPSYTSSSQMDVPQQASPHYSTVLGQHSDLQHEQTPRNLPFDFSTLQGFSLAGELPQASLSIYDVDPIFHESNQPPSTHQQHQHQHQHQNLEKQLHYHHSVAKPAIVQRHEVADTYATVDSKSQKKVKTASPDSKLDKFSLDGSAGQDDEKRRRNTAASARFRIKKKLREQEMEKNHKMMQQRLADQEDRIKQLEMENSWLRNLVVEKNTARDSTSLGRLRQELLSKDGQR